MAWMQCWMLLLMLLLEAQAADGLLTPLSVHSCIRGSVCSERPSSAWDTCSADVSRSALSLQVCQEDEL